MKTLFTLLFLSLITLLVKAQGGNLQFSQIILMKDSDPTITIPANKVWKIENIAIEYPFITNLTNVATAPRIEINGSYAYFSTPYYENSTTTITPQSLSVPFWLPAGTTVGLNNSSSISLLSIIEYNIVP